MKLQVKKSYADQVYATSRVTQLMCLCNRCLKESRASVCKIEIKT